MIESKLLNGQKRAHRTNTTIYSNNPNEHIIRSIIVHSYRDNREVINYRKTENWYNGWTNRYTFDKSTPFKRRSFLIRFKCNARHSDKKKRILSVRTILLPNVLWTNFNNYKTDIDCLMYKYLREKKMDFVYKKFRITLVIACSNVFH